MYSLFTNMVSHSINQMNDLNNSRESGYFSYLNVSMLSDNFFQ